MLMLEPANVRPSAEGRAMHPEITYHLVKHKIQDEHAWAERQRRNRIAHGDPSPDAVAFEGPVEHLSFAARVRAIVGSLRIGGNVAAGTAGA
jgi:hypothetical protein